MIVCGTLVISNTNMLYVQEDKYFNWQNYHYGAYIMFRRAYALFVSLSRELCDQNIVEHLKSDRMLQQQLL